MPQIKSATVQPPKPHTALPAVGNISAAPPMLRPSATVTSRHKNPIDSVTTDVVRLFVAVAIGILLECAVPLEHRLAPLSTDTGSNAPYG